GIFINTAGIGVIPPGIEISGRNARPGDQVLISGTMGDHGMAILASRGGLQFSTTLQSDCAPLNGMVAGMIAASPGIRCLRDPTRGGLAGTLNEIARQSEAGIWVDEASIPVSDEVRGACELLGFEPWHLANEGKLVAIVDASGADAVLDAMRADPLGRNAARIGEVRKDSPGRVLLKTPIGSTRILDMIVGEPLPRIC
ncbi:MAG TPA: AIR synthase-related protein, partial [Thermodesulfobacteriota bacterium]|nr:AIR synthase-related protein [Thermodesulfobacteriota bacterium]